MSIFPFFLSLRIVPTCHKPIFFHKPFTDVRLSSPKHELYDIERKFPTCFQKTLCIVLKWHRRTNSPPRGKRRQNA